MSAAFSLANFLSSSNSGVGSTFGLVVWFLFWSLCLCGTGLLGGAAVLVGTVLPVIGRFALKAADWVSSLAADALELILPDGDCPVTVSLAPLWFALVFELNDGLFAVAPSFSSPAP